MSDGSRLGQLLWDEDDPSRLRWGQMFWNQAKKKSERMRATGMFLNEGEKENKKEWGIEIVKHVWRRKIKKKKKKKRNEMYG